ncbi:MAG: hypothetical protein ABFD75_04970 [Smithella sp.]
MSFRDLISCILAIIILVCLCSEVVSQDAAQNNAVNWVDGYVSAVGEATATPSGNKIKDEMRAVRAATILGQRALLETLKGVRIDSHTKVENLILQNDSVNADVSGMIQSARIAGQSVRWRGEMPVAKVELRICLGGYGVCAAEKSIVNVLGLGHKNEQSGTPDRRLDDFSIKREKITSGSKDITYDLTMPVTGIVFNLQGINYERVILPVIITTDNENKFYTVYSVKSVEPRVIRTYGVVRYANTVDQARRNPYLGGNVLVVPVYDVTKDNMIIVEPHIAKIIQETTCHGNNYFKDAKIVISAR